MTEYDIHDVARELCGWWRAYLATDLELSTLPEDCKNYFNSLISED